MPFDNFTPRLRAVATGALAYCKKRYGAHGLKIDEGLDREIGWRPTFFLRPNRFLILAAEVADIIYPEALKGAAHDIGHYDSPIAVYQVCPLDAYQNDPKQTKIHMLREHGFGIITVDDDGKVTVQHSCVPIAQHISSKQLESEINGLTAALKVNFRSAHATYLTNEGQGLQQASQIVEGLIRSIAAQAAKKGYVRAFAPTAALADVIDELYGKPQFKNHRAALGAARDFVKEFRNVASHAPKTAKAAVEKIRKCKTGFLDAANVSKKLREVMHLMGFQARIYIT
jgi:hypothetical protein